MRKTDDRGFAAVGSAIIVALAVFMGFGAAVIVRRSSMLRQSKLSGQRIARKSHESLGVKVIDNSENIRVVNTGSVPSMFDRVLVKGDNGLNVHPVDPVSLNPLESTAVPYDLSVGGGSDVGVYTRLGNIFWEAQ